VDAGGAVATAAHLAEAEAALQWTADEAWAGRANVSGEVIVLDTRGLPAELVRRLVLRAFREIRGVEPDGPALQRLLAGQGGTLGGVQAEGGPLWRFRAEPPRKMRAFTE
jgi:tRNA(Ile)-lysidine synthase